MDLSTKASRCVLWLLRSHAWLSAIPKLAALVGKKWYRSGTSKLRWCWCQTASESSTIRTTRLSPNTTSRFFR
eukprot:scaffold269_cov404-Prasinococcus_capsulatus_cf.AAC.15